MISILPIAFNKRKLINAISAGLLCFVFSGLGINVHIEPINVTVVWSVIFPVLIALAYGSRYGIIAGFAGAAWFPFCLWANNGYVNILNFFILQSLYFLVGYLNPAKLNFGYRKFLVHLAIIMSIFTALIAVVYIYLFEKAFLLNPSFWAPQSVNHLEKSLLVGFFIKDIINYTFIILLAELLLHLPIIRKILSLEPEPRFGINHRLFVNGFAASTAIWVAFVALDKTLFETSAIRDIKYYFLVLTIIYWSTVIVVRNLINMLEKRLKIEEKLQTSQERQNVMIANIADVIAIIDKNGINRYKSPNVQKWFGWQPEELLGNYAWANIHEDDLELTQSLFSEILSKPASSGNLECRLKSKNGEYKWIEVFAVNCMNIPNIEGVLINYKDISEQKRNLVLQQQIAITKKEAEFKQKFLANMSHEIRTPLTGVMGMADILAKTNLDNKQSEYLHTLIQSSENLKEIIDLILDYSKIEAGKATLKKTIFSFNSLVVDSEYFFHSVSNKNIQWQYSIDNELPPFVSSDKQRINQVIRNLVSNAVKFTDSGIIRLNISRVNTPASLPLHSDEVTVLVEVSDTGQGIPYNLQSKLFEPFYQVENEYTRTHDGTGLGLAICKELVEMLGGEIGFESTPDKGSRFWFTFECCISHEHTKLNKVNAELIPSNSPCSLNILLVEDKKVNQKVIGLLMKSMGHKITIAENGQEALSEYRDGIYNLILMDIQMPVMDGITATRILREKHSNLPPIIGLSANAFEGDREKYISQGLDEYITKPLNMKEFKNKLAILNIEI